MLLKKRLEKKYTKYYIIIRKINLKKKEYIIFLLKKQLSDIVIV